MAEHYSRHADRRQLPRDAIRKMQRKRGAKWKTGADRDGKPRR